MTIADRTRRSPSWGRVVAWLDSPPVTRSLKVVAILSLMMGFITTVQQYQLTQCVAEYSDAANANQQLRAAAAESDREALDVMISAIASGIEVPSGQSRTAIVQALRTYELRRANVDGQREASPFPPPPSQRCG